MSLRGATIFIFDVTICRESRRRRRVAISLPEMVIPFNLNQRSDISMIDLLKRLVP